MKIQHRQYFVAVLVAIGLCAWQVWNALQRFGVGGMHPRADVMQQQVAAHISADPRLAATIALFVILLVASHLLLTMGSVAIFRAATRVVMRDKRDRFLPSMVFLAASLLLAMFANRWLFPLSSAFPVVEVLMIQTLSPVLSVGLVVLVGGAMLCACSAVLKAIRRRVLVGVGAAACSLAVGAWHFSGAPQLREDVDGKPDIIVLGVDSLRPDFVSAYGQMPKGLTPVIDETLSASVVLADARTPLARTFVSYQSMLMGRNPIAHGARFNLYPRTEFSSKGTLAWRLKEHGYATMLAMDESRFANFDASFGFDTTIVPRVGALDFVIGSSFDFLATNLLIAAIPPSNWMSPVQGNRAAYRNYRVDDHPSRVLAALRATPASRPLFLVSHLCLPHWPYMPASLQGDDSFDWVNEVRGYEDSPRQYLRAVAKADDQFGVIIDELRALGRLDNAILVVMSDHGEDFALKRDRLQTDEAGERLVGSYGHGAFALSKAQNHVVMAIQRYRNGTPIWDPRALQGPASVIDLAPTLASEIGLDVSGYEGISWLPNLVAGNDLPADRVLFFENGIRSAGVERPNIDEKSVADEMSYLYRVTDDDRFEIRPELLPKKLHEKQRGAALGRWGVTTDPLSGNSPGARGCWLSVDYQDRAAKCVEFPAQQPEIAVLQGHVCNYYASDRGFTAEWCEPSRDGNRVM